MSTRIRGQPRVASALREGPELENEEPGPRSRSGTHAGVHGHDGQNWQDASIPSARDTVVGASASAGNAPAVAFPPAKAPHVPRPLAPDKTNRLPVAWVALSRNARCGCVVGGPLLAIRELPSTGTSRIVRSATVRSPARPPLQVEGHPVPTGQSAVYSSQSHSVRHLYRSARAQSGSSSPTSVSMGGLHRSGPAPIRKCHRPEVVERTVVVDRHHIAEVDTYSGCHRELVMLRHLRSLVPGDRPSWLCGELDDLRCIASRTSSADGRSEESEIWVRRRVTPAGVRGRLGACAPSPSITSP